VRTLRVRSRCNRVLPAVELDDESSLQANEIDDEWFQYVLTAEFQALHSARTQ
jgi:hypothetical protein